MLKNIFFFRDWCYGQKARTFFPQVNTTYVSNRGVLDNYLHILGLAKKTYTGQTLKLISLRASETEKKVFYIDFWRKEFGHLAVSSSSRFLYLGHHNWGTMIYSNRTLNIRNLLMFVICQSICHLQAFPVLSNFNGQDHESTLEYMWFTQVGLRTLHSCWVQCYKTFYIRNLRGFVMSWSLSLASLSSLGWKCFSNLYCTNQEC